MSWLCQLPRNFFEAADPDLWEKVNRISQVEYRGEDIVQGKGKQQAAKNCPHCLSKLLPVRRMC